MWASWCSRTVVLRLDVDQLFTAGEWLLVLAVIVTRLMDTVATVIVRIYV